MRGRNANLAACALLSICAVLRSANAADHDLRERLTEREDRRRAPQPFSVPLAGRPLTLSGEYEVGFDALRRGDSSASPRDEQRWLHALDAELFYSFDPALSVFAQLHAGFEQGVGTQPDTHLLERGEAWIYFGNAEAPGLRFDLGRLHFEDDRRWWWDTELDALRLSFEAPSFELTAALARELLPARSDRSFVDPQHEQVWRLLGEATWDWHPNHALQIFLLHENDRSAREQIGQMVRSDREDSADARLTWLGARASGALQLGARGLLGYWLDTAIVRGSERRVDFDDLAGQQRSVAAISQHAVRGWAFDTGVNWILPLALEPRLIIGYAHGSGSSAIDQASDRSFRQSGLQANQAGFGGARRYPSYGVVLDPELSNLRVFTLGAGISLFKASSLDALYHRYHLVEPATSLRQAQLDAQLTGTQRDVGSALDVVLALEEWQRVEFELSISVFRAGAAFGTDAGKQSYRAFAALRVAF